jgi:DNA polymerase-3 subunit delta'
MSTEKLWQQFAWAKNTQKMPQAILLNSLDSDNAQMFAFKMAQSLLCQHADQNHQACNSCKSCSLFIAKTHPDLVEIIGDTTIKIDEIRTIQNKLSYSANQNGWKIIIIADAHTMTLNAANALLKILEEPPAQTLFILTTTLLYKIPATVRSRCEKWFVANETVGDSNEIHDELLQELVAFTSKKMSFYDLSQKWAKHNSQDIFKFFFYCIPDLLRLKFFPPQSALHFQHKTKELKYLTETIAPNKLFIFYDVLNKTWQDNQLVNNLNNQLMIENLLLKWK